RINTRFFDMIMAFINTHIKAAPVYITQEIAVENGGPEPELTKTINASYQSVPQGLVFQLAQPGAFHDVAEPQLVTRGLADGAIKFEPDDVVKVKVLPVYINMLYNRGRYLAAYGQHGRAISAFEQALKLDPGSRSARQSLSESQAALRKAAQPSP